ncbi:MAG TPA: hypothetical protein PKK06_03680 [Phycisphaerae bacterium]|nr:hypothetical protein [Phycisphaerae bacterium]HNU45379.1 hypothetical protein [Phycisphaerae bacterium]
MLGTGGVDRDNVGNDDTMNTTASTPEIRVIYCAGGAHRRERRAAPRTIALIVGVLSTVMGAGLYYVTWWPAEHFITPTLIWRTPLPLTPDQAQTVAGAFGVRSPDPSAPHPLPRRPESELGSPSGRRIQGLKAGNIMVATAYVWQGVLSAAAAVLVLAGGATLAPRLTRPARSAALLAVVLVGVAIVSGVVSVWRQYGAGWPIGAARLGVGLALLSVVLLGLGLGRGGRALSRIAAIVLICSAAGTVVALYLGGATGALTDAQSSPAVMLGAFVLQSLYGWLLLWLASRLPRA